jgi:hypothetical protein
MTRDQAIRRLELFEARGVDVPVPASWLRAVYKIPLETNHDGNADRLQDAAADGAQSRSGGQGRRAPRLPSKGHS